MTKQWIGQAPSQCQLCERKLTTSFVDGRVQNGPWSSTMTWAIVCEECHLSHGVGFGTGKAQKFVLDDSGDWNLTICETVDIDGDRPWQYFGNQLIREVFGQLDAGLITQEEAWDKVTACVIQIHTNRGLTDKLVHQALEESIQRTLKKDVSK